MSRYAIAYGDRMRRSTTPRRVRTDLADFLRQRRESLSPDLFGLPSGRRRRTPGLRREEVAALAGVGLSWYTWLEQGREIGVSTDFLDNLARVFRLDAAERRHLYLLAQQRPPPEDGQMQCTVPPLIRRLMADLRHRPAYVLNLRWDVLAWNEAADKVFSFSVQPAGRRNLLLMLFVLPALHRLFHHWEEQAPRILASFRRDFARAPQDGDMVNLVKELEKSAPDFKQWWNKHDVYGPCQGVRSLLIDSVGVVEFEHATMIIDEERHLRLVYYAAIEEKEGSKKFKDWLLNHQINI